MNYFNYFSEIEELFVRRRGRNLLLSPLDWALIETWQEREVPLHVILRGIERVFDSVDAQPPSARKRTVKSLLYCKEEIEAQYAEWLDRQVGKNKNGEDPRPKTQDPRPKSQESSLFSAEAIAAHLERVSLELESAADESEGDWRATLQKILDELNALKGKPHQAEPLEEKLEKLDAQLDRNLLENFETESLTSEIERQIHSYKNKMEREVYERTFDLMLVKRLRERAAVPRLSLFYL